ASSTLADALVANLDVRVPPTRDTSLKEVPLVGASTPKTKYLFFTAIQLSGPGSRVCSPGSRLPNSTLRAWSRSGLNVYAKLRRSTTVSASADLNVRGIRTTMYAW